MRKNLLFLLFISLCSLSVNAQVYLDDFEVDKGGTYTTAGYTSEIADSEWTITGNGSNGPYDPFGYIFSDENDDPISVDFTGNNKIFIRVKASSLGTQYRVDAKDINGYVTTIDNVTETLVNEYAILELEFTSYQDGGYGGTACESADAPCPVDGTQITELVMFLNPGIPGYAGTAVIDFISVGEAPDSEIMSDVYQDEFEGDSVTNYIAYGAGHTGFVEDGVWTINGDGTAGPWNPMAYFFHNMTTLDTADINLTDGENKIFLRAKGSVDGISVRIDVQDIDGFASTLGSVTKIISSEWATYEYDLTGLYQDLGYGGTPCDADTAPCDLDPTRIGNLVIFITPGVEGFSGQVQIEYISIGTALEVIDPGVSEVVYGDHFNDGNLFATSDGAWATNEANSEVTIIGDGTAPPYAAVNYLPHDMQTLEPIVLDVTLNNKIYIKGNSTDENTLIRMDLIDTAGYITTLPSLTKVLTNTDKVLEYDFTGLYTDAGYGGTPCDADSAPCPVDPTAISGILLYPNPDDGGFNGTITLDYISIGAPLGEDIEQYTDQFDNNVNVLTDVSGFISSENEGELLITGDGTAGPYAALGYNTHDQDSGADVVIDLTLNNKLYVKAKTDTDGIPFRIDLLDADGYVTNAQAKVNSLGLEYEVFEFDYTSAYLDGGFGGTPCTADDAPCDVNGTEIVSLLLYVDPDNGGFDGTVTIDWVSTQNPLETIGDPGPKGVEDYLDQFANDVIDNISAANGLTVSESSGILSIVGDGTSEMWTPIVYNTHNQDDESAILVDAVINSNLLYMRAKSSVQDLPLRVDLQDNQGFVTSLAGLTNNIGLEYETYTFDYSNVYQDGGFGGTPCTAGPCDVDGERISAIQFFLKPGEGLFEGTLDIDWISFGQALTDNVINTNIIEKASIFPNPSNGRFIIEVSLKTDVQNIDYRIYDLTGQLVFSDKTPVLGEKNTKEITVDNLVSGAYILTAHANGHVLFNQKLMIR